MWTLMNWTARLAETCACDSADSLNMVLIPDGEVQLGSTEEVIRAHFSKHDLTEEQVEAFVKLALEEPRTRIRVPRYARSDRGKQNVFGGCARRWRGSR